MIPVLRGGQRQKGLGDCWPGGLAELSSYRFYERVHLKNDVDSDIIFDDAYPEASAHAHMHMLRVF